MENHFYLVLISPFFRSNPDSPLQFIPVPGFAIKEVYLRISLQFALGIQPLGDDSSDIHHRRCRRVEDLVRVCGELDGDNGVCGCGEGQPLPHLGGQGLQVDGFGLQLVDRFQLLWGKLCCYALKVK